MILNYIKISIRNFLRDKGYSFINVTGLAIGMTCALLIGLYIWDELRYDSFHENKNLFRVALHRTFSGNDAYYATTPVPLAEVLTNEYSEVKKATRIFSVSGEVRVRQDNTIFFERHVLAADSNFFDLFSIKMLQGNPDDALQLQNSVVLTQSTAKKYFGNDNPIGKQLSIFSDTTSYLVTGVTEDIPAYSHFTFDLLLSFVSFPLSESTSWVSYNVYNYVVLDQPESKGSLEKKFPKLAEQYLSPEVETLIGKKYDEYVAAGNYHDYHLQPIQDIHLHSNYQNELKTNGDIRYIYLFSAVCFFILLIAGVNFTNLSTARSLRRAKEIGVRKVHGSLRKQLIFQFLTESLMVTLLSLVVAIMGVLLLLKSYNEFTLKNISLFELNPFWVGVILLGMLLINGILAGIYPALIISALRPVEILKGKMQSGKNKAYFRNALVVVQFGISIVLIVSTLVIYRQLDFMRHKKLGFDKDHVIVIERANLLSNQREAFNEEIRLIPGIKAVGNGQAVPGDEYSGATFQVIGAESTERIIHATGYGDLYLPEALGVEIIAGRSFSKDVADDSLAVVVNEALVKRVGWKTMEEAIGQKIRPVFDRQNQYEIIGVSKDFNFESLRTAIRPHAFYANNNKNYNPPLCIIDIKEGTDAVEINQAIKKTWNKFLPGEQFEYAYLDDQFDQLYGQEERFGAIFSLFSGLSIFIGAIGVIGLSSFMASQRAKEIGIRKVVGASVPRLLLLLSKDFLKLVLIANLIFWPLAWYGLDQWLSNYPFRTQLTISVFILTGVVTAAIVFLSVTWQSLRASLANPVKSLRSE